MKSDQSVFIVSEDPSSAVIATLVFHPLVVYANERGGIEIVNNLNNSTVEVNLLNSLTRRVKILADGRFLYIAYADATVIVITDEGEGLVFELWEMGFDDSSAIEVVLYKDLGIIVA